MKYAISTCLRFTMLEVTIQMQVKTDLDALHQKQFKADDSHVTSLPDGSLTSTLRFNEKDLITAETLYNTLTPLLKPAIPNSQPFVELHECFHDEQPPRPCRVIKRNQL